MEGPPRIEMVTYEGVWEWKEELDNINRGLPALCRRRDLIGQDFPSSNPRVGIIFLILHFGFHLRNKHMSSICYFVLKFFMPENN